MQPPVNRVERLARLKQGEPKAFQSFFEEYYRALVHFATSLTNNLMEADDQVSIIFIKLWNMRERFNEDSSV